MASDVAFEILYREYYVRVFGLCRRLLNAAPLAEDATQEAFVKAYRQFDKYEPTEPFWQWIAAIARNHCIDMLRQKSRTDNLFGDEYDELQSLASNDQDTLASLISSEDRDALATAISQLPDKYRVPIVMAYFAGASYDEIAADLSISRNHVGVLLLRAKQQLRTTIKGDLT